MKGEILELGIEPIQLFGFLRGPSKNAADIQLAIDVVEMAHVRPAIEVFATVSGDGAFAPLARTLHEYGKIVIGSSYQSAANHVFAVACDDFFWIPDPEEEPERLPVLPHSSVAERAKKKVAVCRQPDEVGEVAATARKVIDWFGSDKYFQATLKERGISTLRWRKRHLSPSSLVFNMKGWASRSFSISCASSVAIQTIAFVPSTRRM